MDIVYLISLQLSVVVDVEKAVRNIGPQFQPFERRGDKQPCKSRLHPAKLVPDLWHAPWPRQPDRERWLDRTVVFGCIRPLTAPARLHQCRGKTWKIIDLGYY